MVNETANENFGLGTYNEKDTEGTQIFHSKKTVLSQEN